MSLRGVALLCDMTTAAVIAGCESSTAPVPSVSPIALQTDASRASAVPATPVVFATGLQYPRGLTFGPDTDLYVAEAGSLGTSSTSAAQCTPRHSHRDISKTQGHFVPTVVAERRGALYVSSLGLFPSTPGSPLGCQARLACQRDGSPRCHFRN